MTTDPPTLADGRIGQMAATELYWICTKIPFWTATRPLRMQVCLSARLILNESPQCGQFTFWFFSNLPSLCVRSFFGAIAHLLKTATVPSPLIFTQGAGFLQEAKKRQIIHDDKSMMSKIARTTLSPEVRRVRILYFSFTHASLPPQGRNTWNAGRRCTAAA